MLLFVKGLQTNYPFSLIPLVCTASRQFLPSLRPVTAQQNLAAAVHVFQRMSVQVPTHNATFPYSASLQTLFCSSKLTNDSDRFEMILFLQLCRERRCSVITIGIGLVSSADRWTSDRGPMMDGPCLDTNNVPQQKKKTKRVAKKPSVARPIQDARVYKAI